MTIQEISLDLLQAGLCSFAGAVTVNFLGRVISPIIRSAEEITEAQDSTPAMKVVHAVARVTSAVGRVFYPTENRESNGSSSRAGIVLGGVGALAIAPSLVTAGVVAVGVGASCTNVFNEVVAAVGDMTAQTCVNSISSMSASLGRGISQDVFNRLINECRALLRSLPSLPFIESLESPQQNLHNAKYDTNEELGRLARQKSRQITVELLLSHVLLQDVNNPEVKARIDNVMQDADVSGDLMAAYFNHFWEGLTWQQALKAWVWFYFAQEFIASFTSDFCLRILEQAREKFISANNDSLVDLSERLIHRLTGFFEGRVRHGLITEEAFGELNISCELLISTLVDTCMPPIFYFQKFHDVFFIGWFFRKIDELINQHVQGYLAEELKESISESFFNLVSEALEPEKIQPKISRLIALITDSIRRGEDLESPLPDTDGFARLEESLRNCLNELYNCLDIPRFLPLANLSNVREWVCRFTTQELLKTIFHHGDPIEVERSLLHALREFDEEDSTLRPEVSFQDAVDDLMSALSDSLILGNPAHVHILFKGACIKQYGLLKECVRCLRKNRESMIFCNPSGKEVVGFLQKETWLLQNFFEEARSFSARMEGLPEVYQRSLRANFYPIYAKLKESIEIQVFLQEYYDDINPREERYNLIRKLMNRSDEDLESPPEGQNNFCTSLARALDGLLRSPIFAKNKTNEWSMASEWVKNFRDAPLSMKKELKSSFLSLVVHHGMWCEKEKIEKEERKDKIRREAEELLCLLQAEMLKDAHKSISFFSIQPLVPQVLPRLAERFIPKVLLQESTRNELFGRITEGVLSKNAHVFLTSYLFRELVNGICC